MLKWEEEYLVEEEENLKIGIINAIPIAIVMWAIIFAILK